MFGRPERCCLTAAILLLLAAGCEGQHPDGPSGPATPATRDAVSLEAGPVGLMLSWQNTCFAPAISHAGSTYSPYEGEPVRIEVFPRDLGTSTWYTAGYEEAVRKDGGIVCNATVTTGAGSVFGVEDRYTVDGERGSVRLSRKVSVQKAAAADFAFNTYVMLKEEAGGTVNGTEYFLPALVYRSSAHLSAGAIGADFSDDWVLAREDRMGLPLAMMRREGVSVALADIREAASTVRDDFGMGHLVDPAFRFGSLGYFLRTGAPVLTWCYPGSEGERSYADGGSPARKRWARRSHPVSPEVDHSYTLELQFDRNEDFPSALKAHWRRTFAVYDPPVADVADATVLEAGLEVLDRYWMEDAGAPGWPFSVHLPSGQIHEISYDMGFVGMQIPCAYYLYRAGLERGQQSWTAKGEAVLDWWAANSPNEEGMPRVWWDISPWNLWRNSNDLRNMQGGLEAMLLAWIQAEKQMPGSKPAWLAFCTRAADWLLSRQYGDGSWDKSYDNSGTVIDSGRLLTSNPIRFLTELYAATEDARYREAAIRAGEFCLEQIHTPYRYVGSVIDNPYVLDRESGQKALEAFLSLYETTGQKRWLDAAVQAAYYTVSYMYVWDIRQPEGSTLMAWDRRKTTVGITIIATGHSGADAGLAYNSYEYFRLYDLTGDPFLLKIARLLEKNTKQTMNYDGSLGYAFKGLQTEALRVVTHWGDNVNLWLPWLTAAALDPLFRLQDAYGQMEIDTIIKTTEP